MKAIIQLTKQCLLLKKGYLIQDDKTENVVDQYTTDHFKEASNTEFLTDSERYDRNLKKEIEFVSVNLKSKYIRLIKSDEPLCIELEVKGNKSIKGFRFSFTIFCNDNTPVGSAFSDDNLEIELNETAHFLLQLYNHRLAIGKYYLGMAIGSGNDIKGYKDYDVILEMMHFEVMGPDNIDGTLSMWYPGWGSIRYEQPHVEKLNFEKVIFK